MSGLWLPAAAAAATGPSRHAGQADFGRFSPTNGQLRPYTINGFPYDNFHQPVVKHRVYLPAWWDPQRLEYTRQLADDPRRVAAR